ncbi:MAG: hypothetical protein Q9187_006200 [Circinaria calcarea]
MAAQSAEENRSALVLYGSETGNAHDVADEIGRMLERLRFSTYVTHLDAVDPASMVNHNIVVITVSTTGQGDLPHNARVFWKRLLRKKLSPKHLEGVNLTTFGLGDSSYPKYNWAARKLHKRLAQLGAEEIYQRGEADEQHPEGSDASFLPWLSGLRQHLLQLFPLGQGVEPIPDDLLLEPRWTLALDHPNSDLGLTSHSVPGFESCSGMSAKAHFGEESVMPINGSYAGDQTYGNHLRVVLEENRRLTPADHWQDVRHLAMTAEDQVSYKPGDVLTIYPKNPPDDVETILRLMHWTDIADLPIHFERSRPAQDHIVCPLPNRDFSGSLTLRNLLINHLDINAIPRRSFFSIIAQFTTDPFQKDRLIEFTKPEYLDELYDYTTRPRRSILEVLQEFDTVKIPWQWAANVLPELRGRQFSIASGGQLRTSGSSTRFELLVAIVKYKTVIKKIREGTCTRYIAGLPVGTSLQVTLQEGGLGISQGDAKRPAVMIGPGTGVAPMRSLIWERLQWDEQMAKISQAGNNSLTNGYNGIGKSVLFFGNRNYESDYFYQREWQTLEEKMPLHVLTAFSRDQKEKIYVQAIIKEQSKTVFDALHISRGTVYICGSSGKMPQAVREALVEVFQSEGAMERDAAEAYLLSMEKEGRYKQETW